jgi:N-acetylglucosamine kinase-like BadF-type ATPase
VTGANEAEILIAVDGGGSKTDAVAVDTDGNVLARVRGSGSAFDTDRMKESVRIVDQVISEVHREIGSPPLLQTSIYLSGLDTDAEIESFTVATSDKWWASGDMAGRVVIDNDMFALLRAGTERADAVAVVCGTGINCVGVRADGMHARFMAWGMVSGDWGGGWDLGEQAIWHAARALDGRGPWTSLVSSIPAALGATDLIAVIEGVHFGRISPQRYSLLAPLVLEAAIAGDGPARVIVDRQATEIVDLAVSALNRLKLLDKPVPVILGGGVISSGNARLLAGIRNELAHRAPYAYVEIVHSRPILGAALLALEAVGAGAPALARARARLERANPRELTGPEGHVPPDGENAQGDASLEADAKAEEVATWM